MFRHLRPGVGDVTHYNWLPRLAYAAFRFLH
jgi:hypothetical protein